MTSFGIYRRAIEIALDADRGHAEMADDAHHFAASISFEGGLVTQVVGYAIRTPWTLCPSATEQLRQLEGAKAPGDARALRAGSKPESQCTHMLDLALLLIPLATGARLRRRYDATVPLDSPERRTVTLDRDGTRLLTWEMEGDTIVSGGAFAGSHLRDVVSCARRVDPQPGLAEAAGILRRAIFTSIARTMDLDKVHDASALGDIVGPCFVFRPSHAERARRMLGSTVNFTHSGAPPLQGAPAHAAVGNRGGRR
jgi:hypothetical protein